MRIFAFIIILLAGLACGALGGKWLMDAQDNSEIVALAKSLGISGELDRLVMAAYFLVGAGVASLIGEVLVLKRKGLIAGLLVIAAAGAAAFFSSKIDDDERRPVVLAMTGVLGFGGLLALLVKPKRIAAQPEEEEELELIEPEPKPAKKPLPAPKKEIVVPARHPAAREASLSKGKPSGSGSGQRPSAGKLAVAKTVPMRSSPKLIEEDLLEPES